MLSKNNTQHHTTRQCFSVLSLEITFKKQAWAQESVKTSKHVKTVSMNICASTQLFLFRGDQCQNVQQTAYSGPFWLPDRDLVSKVFMRGCFTATTPSNPHEDNVIQMEFNRTFLSWSIDCGVEQHPANCMLFKFKLSALFANCKMIWNLSQLSRTCPSASLVASGGDFLDVPDPAPFQGQGKFSRSASN